MVLYIIMYMYFQIDYFNYNYSAHLKNLYSMSRPERLYTLNNIGS